jgi:signal peptidase I
MVLMILRISGQSLYPILQNGDFVIVSKIPILIAGIKPGDVVVFNHPVYRKIIKKVERIENGGEALFVVGENDDSVDSRRFGSIPRRWVLAKVIGHIKRNPRG